jgi:polyisoprenoid-binding protein YceI
MINKKAASAAFFIWGRRSLPADFSAAIITLTFKKTQRRIFMQLLKPALMTASLLFALNAFAATAPAAGTYQVDPAHSRVGFEVPHLVISTVEGRFGVAEGTITLKDKFEKSHVKASAEIGSIDTSNAKRDEHLRSADFFDAAKHPKMTFDSKSIKGTPESFKMTGDLTIKGVKKSVVFDGKYLGSVNDGMGNDKVAFTATTQIKRADFGLTWNKAVEAGPVVGDTVTITLKIEAGKPAAKK